MAIKVIFILVVAAILFRIEMPVLWKFHTRKDAVVFVSLLAIAVTFALTKSMGQHVPTPLYFVSWLFRPVSDLIRELQ